MVPERDILPQIDDNDGDQKDIDIDTELEILYQKTHQNKITDDNNKMNKNKNKLSKEMIDRLYNNPSELRRKNICDYQININIV